MTFNIIKVGLVVFVLCLASAFAQTPDPKVGVIILAYGGKANWNEEVMKVRAEVDKVYPAEVAFGMASRRTIQAAADKLVEHSCEARDLVGIGGGAIGRRHFRAHLVDLGEN